MQLMRDVDMSWRAVAAAEGIVRHDAMRIVVARFREKELSGAENGDRMNDDAMRSRRSLGSSSREEDSPEGF